LFVTNLALKHENGVETLDGFGEFFVGHGNKAFGHPHVGVFEQRKNFGRRSGKMRQAKLQESAAGEAGIYPLGEVTEEDSGVFAVRIDGFKEGPVCGEALDATLDPPKGKVSLYLGEEVSGDFGAWFVS
jgi:hypothetical protein